MSDTHTCSYMYTYNVTAILHSCSVSVSGLEFNNNCAGTLKARSVFTVYSSTVAGTVGGTAGEEVGLLLYHGSR